MNFELGARNIRSYNNLDSKGHAEADSIIDCPVTDVIRASNFDFQISGFQGIVALNKTQAHVLESGCL